MTRPELTLIEGGDDSARQATRWFVRMRADDATEAERTQWQAWLRADASHRAAYARVEHLWSSLGGHAHAPEIAECMRQLAHAASRPTARAWHRISLAASLLVVLGALWLAWPATAPADPVEHATARGERRSIELTDGSVVDLDAATRIRVAFDRHERIVTLVEGRAFFRVAKDPARAFRVRSDLGAIEALGTQFDVSRLPDALDVGLYEGRVALLPQAAADQSARPLGTLAAGQRARLSGDGVTMMPGSVAGNAAPEWMSGRLVFDDTPLSEAVADFNRYSAQPLVVADPAVGARRISGVFRGEDPQGFIEALHEVYGIGGQQRADGARILGGTQ
ncbi:MAG: FecR family protein [Luteimonas sp.]